MSAVNVSVAVKNSCSTIGEGPHWDPASKSLLYVDIHEGGIHRYNPTTGSDEKFHLGNSEFWYSV